jgi:hypothetical protein
MSLLRPSNLAVRPGLADAEGRLGKTSGRERRGLLTTVGYACDLGCVRFRLVASAAFAATLTAAGAVAASSAKSPPTVMYRGTKNVGLIQPTTIGTIRAETWDVECGDSEFVTRGRSPRERTRINVHWWDGVVVAYSRLQAAGRWVIYRYTSGVPPRLAGFAVRRSSTRWDVLRGQRNVGHTIGHDGPAAASALLTVC